MRATRSGQETLRSTSSVTDPNHHLVAPDQPRLLHEAGLLHIELGQIAAAAAALERFLDHAEAEDDRRRAAVLLQRLKLRLN